MDTNERNSWASKNQSECLKSAKEDEPVFVLLARDKTSAKVVIHWIAKNFDTCNEEKLRDAFECALAMKEYPVKKDAD